MRIMYIMLNNRLCDRVITDHLDHPKKWLEGKSSEMVSAAENEYILNYCAN